MISKIFEAMSVLCNSVVCTLVYLLSSALASRALSATHTLENIEYLKHVVI